MKFRNFYYKTFYLPYLHIFALFIGFFYEKSANFLAANVFSICAVYHIGNSIFYICSYVIGNYSSSQPQTDYFPDLWNGPELPVIWSIRGHALHLMEKIAPDWRSVRLMADYIICSRENCSSQKECWKKRVTHWLPLWLINVLNEIAIIPRNFIISFLHVRKYSYIKNSYIFKLKYTLLKSNNLLV